MFDRIALWLLILVLVTHSSSCRGKDTLAKESIGTKKRVVYQIPPYLTINYSFLCPELSNQCFRCYKQESLLKYDLRDPNPIHFNFCRTVSKRPYHVLFQYDSNLNDSKRLFFPYYDEETNLNLEKSYIFLQYRF